jgi:hypothetical protein
MPCINENVNKICFKLFDKYMWNKFFLFYHCFMCGKKILTTILRNVKLKKIQIQILEIFINIEYFSTCQP